MLVIWDVQTGVVISRIATQAFDGITFHGDQRTITLVTQDWKFYTYSALEGTQLCQGQVPSLEDGGGGGTYWVHENTLRFATASRINEESVITIYELQPASTPPLCLLSSFHVFPMPLRGWLREFYFSPVSFHAAFKTKSAVFIYDVQDSKLMLSADGGRLCGFLTKPFSPDGRFFVCNISYDELCIWHNTPTGYVEWSHLKPRLPFSWFSWSPTLTSILCWGPGEIQLLHLENCPTQAPNKVKPCYLHENNLVTHPTDGAWKDGVTVLDHLLGLQPWPTNRDMQILGVKIAHNTTFVLGVLGLAAWHGEMSIARSLSAGETHSHKTPAIDADSGSLMSSLDLSQVIFTDGERVYLYNIKTQKTVPEDVEKWTMTNWGNQHQLWSILVGCDWHYVTLVGPVRVTNGGTEMGGSSLGPPLYGYNVKGDSEWVMDSRGRKLLWLPPNWRNIYWSRVTWGGDFLAKFDFSKTILIEFQW